MLRDCLDCSDNSGELAEPRVSQGRLRPRRSGHAYEPNLEQRYAVDAWLSRFLDSARSLVYTPWQRTWVVQEIAKGRKYTHTMVEDTYPGLHFQSQDVESIKFFLTPAHSIASSHAPEKHPLNSQNREEAFWRTLIGDNHPISDLPQNEVVQFQWPAQLVYADYCLVLVNGMSSKKESVKQGQEQAVGKANFAFTRALVKACSDEKRFAITEDGRMAPAPLLTVGDKIFFVCNAPQPILF